MKIGATIKLNIYDFIFLEEIVEKLNRKHNVHPREVIEVFSRFPVIRFVEKAHIKGENVYAALGQTGSGRYLTVFFVFKKIEMH